MTTSVLDRAMVDQITAQARQVSIGRTLLTVIASVLFGVGWVAARSFFCLAWCAVAVKVGWREGRQLESAGPPPPR